ncbi:hypothetical protein BKA58DRAFT_374584, partial [Alternaria rosae]|uniref:uncharacterized protein n=1 Tax=Alternaria rosae TaxID=1187941 RepID=UPI001E8E0ACC
MYCLNSPNALLDHLHETSVVVVSAIPTIPSITPKRPIIVVSIIPSTKAIISSVAMPTIPAYATSEVIVVFITPEHITAKSTLLIHSFVTIVVTIVVSIVHFINVSLHEAALSALVVSMALSSPPSTLMILPTRLIKTHLSGFVVSLLPSAVANIVWCIDMAGEIAVGSVAICFVADSVVTRVVVVIVRERVGVIFSTAAFARAFARHDWLLC